MIRKDAIELDEAKTKSINEALGITEKIETVKSKIDWLDFILDTKTGKGSIESYDKHDLNFTNSRGTAHIIRGLVGFFGNTDRAIVDVLVGVLMELKRVFLDDDKNKVKSNTKINTSKVEVL